MALQKHLPGRKALGTVTEGKDMDGNPRNEVKSLRQFKGQTELDATGGKKTPETSNDKPDDWG